MRIAFVYDAAYPFVNGGAERRYHELAKRLAKRHEVDHLTWRYWDGPPEVVENGVRLRGIGFPPPLYGADGKRRLGEAVAFSARLLPALLRSRYDVIDCSATPYLPLYPVSLAAKVTGTPLVATWHEFWGERWHEYLPERPLVAAVASRIEARSRTLADMVVAVSPFTSRRMGAPAAKQHRIVGNGVSMGEIDAIRPSQERSDVVFIGRLIDEKRVDVLLDALALLRKQRRDVTCTVVGDGPERHRLEQRAAGLGIADLVRFTGHVPGNDAVALIKAASLLALPSIREGFGMTVLEAQACGTVPVVVRSPSSAASDLVADGVDGAACDRSASAIASALGSLVDNPAQLRAMASAARRRAALSDWDNVADAMEAIYSELIESRAANVAERRLKWS